MRLLRLLGLIVLSMALLVHHGPAAASAAHVHGPHDAGHATGGPCGEQEHAHRGTADPCEPQHAAALHGSSCWGACCLAGSAGAILARGAEVEAPAWPTEEGTRGSRAHALDPPPPRPIA